MLTAKNVSNFFMRVDQQRSVWIYITKCTSQLHCTKW